MHLILSLKKKKCFKGTHCMLQEQPTSHHPLTDRRALASWHLHINVPWTSMWSVMANHCICNVNEACVKAVFKNNDQNALVLCNLKCKFKLTSCCFLFFSKLSGSEKSVLGSSNLTSFQYFPSCFFSPCVCGVNE